MKQKCLNEINLIYKEFSPLGGITQIAFSFRGPLQIFHPIWQHSIALEVASDRWKSAIRLPTNSERSSGAVGKCNPFWTRARRKGGLGAIARANTVETLRVARAGNGRAAMKAMLLLKSF